MKNTQDIEEKLIEHFNSYKLRIGYVNEDITKPEDEDSLFIQLDQNLSFLPKISIEESLDCIWKTKGNKNVELIQEDPECEILIEFKKAIITSTIFNRIKKLYPDNINVNNTFIYNFSGVDNYMTVEIICRTEDEYAKVLAKIVNIIYEETTK
jgi:hypothetical protein